MAPTPSLRVASMCRIACRGLVPALALSFALGATPASAGLPEDRQAEAEAAFAGYESEVLRLESDLGPGGLVDDLAAVNRFQDSLFQEMIGEHEAAAEGFFALVTTGALADAGLHRDAEWYLAEALLGMRNFVTAEQRFRSIAAVADHPFRHDAVRRLLELYTDTGDIEAFRALYADEIASGKVPATPEVNYSLARSFYRQGDLVTAREKFALVGGDSEWHAKARYFIGVIAVAQERLDDAIAEFQGVAELSITSDDGRRVHDLALLALGRIHYERGDYLQAATEYNRIGGDSEYEADKLYEVIWTSIKQERYREAINNIEIFLLAFPEHRYSAQLMLNQGHLAVQASDWSGALVSYEQVIVDYEPVRSRFATLADPSVDSEETVAAVLDMQRPEFEGGLPSYALAMMRADPELSRAVQVFHDLEVQRADIETSEALLRDLEGVMANASTVKNLERIRFDASKARIDVLRAHMALLEGEEVHLAQSDAGAAVAAEELRGRRQELVIALDAGEEQFGDYSTRLASYETRLATLDDEAEALRPEVETGQADADALREELETRTDIGPKTRASMEEDLAEADAALADAQTRLDALDAQIEALKAPSVVAELARAGVDLDEISQALDVLVADAKAARPGNRDLVSDRFDALHLTASRLDQRLGTVVRSTIASETNELGRIQARFEHEKEAVASQRADYDGTFGIARDVSLQLTRDGFGRLEDFFAESVLKADMGIVDVYWAQKLEVADEIERVKNEKDALLTELQQRFKLIRQKIGN